MLGIPALRSRRGVGLPVILGAAAAVLSAAALLPGGEAGWIEGGALLMPWTALLFGLGVESCAGLLRSPALRLCLHASIAAGLLAVPALHREQLHALHAPAETDAAFREMLRSADPRCGILVTPPDASPQGDPGRRYRLMAWEEFERDPSRPRGDAVVMGAPDEENAMPCYHEWKQSRK